MALMNHGNARKDEQRKVMAQIEKDGVCSFCLEHMPKYHPNPILKTGEHWYVTQNAWPYDNTAHHFLLITMRHISDSKELTDAEWIELLGMQKWLALEFNTTGGTLMMRTGDMAKSGSTVSHLHTHFIVAADAEKPVITRVG